MVGYHEAGLGRGAGDSRPGLLLSRKSGTGRVLHDLGIGVLPDYLMQDFPDLVQVLPDTESADVPVFLAYPEELRQSQRVSAFKDFVQDEIISYRKQLKNL